MSLSILDQQSGINDLFVSTRRQTINICKTLEVEDYNLQGMADTSPPKWHLAHTTWFYETFILLAFDETYKEFNPHFAHLFNSCTMRLSENLFQTTAGIAESPDPGSGDGL